MHYELRDRLLLYLKEQTKVKKLRYLKAKWIGKDLGLSAKQVGSNLAVLRHETDELIIEQYSCGVGCTTWRVELV